MSDGLFYSILSLLIAIIVIIGIYSANIEKTIMQKQAIEHNAAFYDTYTAAFTWRENKR